MWNRRICSHLHDSETVKHQMDFYLIYLWPSWVFLAAVFSLVTDGGGSSLVCGLLTEVAAFVAEHGALGAVGFSSCGFWAQEHQLNRCAQLSCFKARWIFLDQRSNTRPAAAGGFFTTEPPGKPRQQADIKLHGDGAVITKRHRALHHKWDEQTQAFYTTFTLGPGLWIVLFKSWVFFFYLLNWSDTD